MAAEALDRDSTVDRCHAVLQEGILSGRFAAGERLRQEQLAAELGISRTPLREALGRLASEGLVELLPHRGARVADPGRGIVIDSYYARLAIETEAARLAARRRTDADLRAMRRAVAALREPISIERGFEWNRRFHLALVGGSHNEYLIRFARQLWASRLALPIYQRQSAGWAEAPRPERAARGDRRRRRGGRGRPCRRARLRAHRPRDRVRRGGGVRAVGSVRPHQANDRERRVSETRSKRHPVLLKVEAARARSVQLRVADAITSFAGSMTFVYIHIVWFAAWIGFHVEKFPFGLLTMIVSLEAIFLSTFVMISQNRSDVRRAALADHQWAKVQAEEKQNQRLLELSEQILELTSRIAQRDDERGRRDDERAAAEGGEAPLAT